MEGDCYPKNNVHFLCLGGEQLSLIAAFTSLMYSSLIRFINLRACSVKLYIALFELSRAISIKISSSAIGQFFNASMASPVCCGGLRHFGRVNSNRSSKTITITRGIYAKYYYKSCHYLYKYNSLRFELLHWIQHTIDNSKADQQLKLSTVCVLLAPFSSFLTD